MTSSDASMRPSPLSVSIVIPTHQRAERVTAAVASVLAQAAVDLEAIVVDDGSTDGTEAAIRAAFQDPRLRYVWQPNGGRSSARNHGLALARGPFVGFLDSDDQLEPGALVAHMAAFAANPDLGMTVAGYSVVDERGAVVDERLPWLTGGRLDLAGWLFDCYGMPGSVLHRRTWLDRVGGFDPDSEIAEDWDLYLRMAAAGCPIRFVDCLACRYRQHDGNSVHDVERRWRASRTVVERVFATSGLPTDVRGLERRALAWVELVAARRGLLGGAAEFATKRLDAAVAIDPELATTRRRPTLAFLISPEPGDATLEDTAVGHIARVLKASAREIRAARADAHMASFFQATQRARWPAARRSLASGLRMEPRWLLNRGVLRLGLKSLAAARRPSASAPPVQDRTCAKPELR